MPVSPPFVPTIEDWNSTVPPAPIGQQNVVFQADPPTANPRRKSAYLPVFVGDTGTGGLAGAVPPPPPGSAAAGDFLWAGGSWASPGISGMFVTPVSGGGTGVTTLAAHAVVVGEGINPVATVGPGPSGYPLLAQGAGKDPVFAPLDLTVGVGNILPVPHGGTGDGTLTAHAVLLGEGVAPIGFASPGASGQVLTSNGPGTDPSFQTAPVVYTPFGEIVTIGTGSSTGTLTHPPNPPSFLIFVRNGVIQQVGGSAPDCTLSGATVTLTIAARSGDVFMAFYTY